MKIIISPAKQMQVETDLVEAAGTPAFLEKAGQISGVLKTYEKEELKKLFQANDKITELNYQRYRNMDLDAHGTPAVLAYVGIQYQSMAPRVFTEKQWTYVRDHLYILSGLYGALKAMDGVVPYRLEMQAKLSVNGSRDLYDYWGDSIYQEIIKEEGQSPVIINLASKEYSKAVEPYLKPGDRFLTCVFGEEVPEKTGRQKIKVKATQAKMARGSMVRFLADRQAETPEIMKEFDLGGYCFSEELSSENEYVFLKKLP